MVSLKNLDLFDILYLRQKVLIACISGSLNRSDFLKVRFKCCSRKASILLALIFPFFEAIKFG